MVVRRRRQPAETRPRGCPVLIVAALAWYSETEATLERCARSLGGVCDILVALGGRWENMPPVTGDDPFEQSRAIRRGADEAGILCDVAWQPEVFGSQVEKRAELMAAARGAGEWVFVIDADEYVADADTDAITRTLEQTRADVATIHGIRHPAKLSVRRPWRRMYRSSTGVTVEVAHNGYRAADGRWLYGDPAHVTLEPSVDLTKHLLLVHDVGPDVRTSERVTADRAYIDARRTERFEAWPTAVPA